MGPKDDCESWFYLLLDLILVGGLPWKKLNEKNEVLLAKEECRKEKRHTLYTGLKYTVELNKILVRVSAGIDIDAPYDWENSKEQGTSKEKSSRTK
ncbi:unnamed protein product [Caenorhabditis brenneri]